MSFDLLDAAWSAAREAPPTGRVDALVVRLGGDAHAMPDRIELQPGRGVLGDRWSAAATPNPDAEVSLIARSVAQALVNGDPSRLHVPGDNIVVDLALDEVSLPVGARLRAGSALLEISRKPHTGCVKFKARLGEEALRWIADPRYRGLRMRGVYARVIEGGELRVGDRFAPA